VEKTDAGQRRGLADQAGQLNQQANVDGGAYVHLHVWYVGLYIAHNMRLEALSYNDNPINNLSLKTG